MTRQEKHLWYDFLKKQPQQFYRQRIIGQYIADFYCPTAKLIIELDGSQHYEEKESELDRQRTAYLENLGVTVMRFSNLDLDNNFEGVCMTILSHLR